ncbi:FKBP-type peptidyl-prolyl cis-trans isomerases 1, homolog to macrophage infectivity potentiator MIP of Legionella species [gamma proteobacterium HdN1]|nr:FKBP-type peptidyl-prolyl cis-trans isomerases 1, homolog to macrophage infectivity potentiator MIP of Legionella species [gamma proteobacterium HdN1]
MKKTNLVLAVAAIVGSGVFAVSSLQADSLKTEDAKVSYSIGLKYGENFLKEYKELDLDAFAKGMTDGFKGNKPAIEEAEIMATMQAFQKRKMEEMRSKAEQLAKDNKAKGEAFLADNAKRKGVVKLPDGLQYEVLKSGKGATPKADDKVKVHYHGTLVDGTVFDSSVQRGEPVTFGVNQVIKGWTEVLQKMKVGDKWKVFIPSDLAYGERSVSEAIGPNETLVFEIELLDVNPEAKPAAK